jgi:2-polyprenyl-6-methoxyphenol hydroxylase-like FAD-dependent oxidoreductase
VKRGEVLIVGAGIGGLSASIALQGKGFGVTIQEIQPDLHSSVYGVGIIQPVNALRALDAVVSDLGAENYGKTLITARKVQGSAPKWSGP